MTQDTPQDSVQELAQESVNNSSLDLPTDTLIENDNEEFLDDDFVSITHCHALAAQHFQAAARQHLQAADAHDAGNLYETHRRAYLAYRHQLLATQYAEMAAIEEDEIELDDDDMLTGSNGDDTLNDGNDIDVIVVGDGEESPDGQPT